MKQVKRLYPDLNENYYSCILEIDVVMLTPKAKDSILAPFRVEVDLSSCNTL